jgi:hypothetical protein
MPVRRPKRSVSRRGRRRLQSSHQQYTQPREARRGGWCAIGRARPQRGGPLMNSPAPRPLDHAAPVVPGDRAHLRLDEAARPAGVAAGGVAELGRARPRRRSPSRARRARRRCGRRRSARARRRGQRRVRVVAPSSGRNATAKTIPISPPDAPIASICASVRWRVPAHGAWAPECDAISGAASMRASQKPAPLMWLRSTAMPSWAQRRTSAAPASVSPDPLPGDAGTQNGTPWANAFWRLQTGPSERRPARCQRSSASSRRRSPRRPRGASPAASTPSRRAASRSRAARCAGGRRARGQRHALRPAATSWSLGSASAGAGAAAAAAAGLAEVRFVASGCR